MFLPTLGTPLVGLPVVGFGERGERDVVVGLDRYRVGEVEVVTGPRPRLHIPLDRLMAGAQLEEGADPILASVVAQTEGASVPRLALTVHSGGTQGAGDQLATTVAQSAVLVEELQRRLGADWTVTGTGVGARRRSWRSGAPDSTPRSSRVSTPGWRSASVGVLREMTEGTGDRGR